ncbi:hypothetical protein [Streptomyces sp. NPDC047000]|uniref:hypothetical protein n=1 Tax=Streptomyces sp. NPDC047000 TaxID=3155474 RepID=UPI0033D13D2C
MTDPTPRTTPAGTPADRDGRPAGARTERSTGTPGGTVSGTPPTNPARSTRTDTAPGTRARPLAEKAATGAPDQDRFATPRTTENPTAPATTHAPTTGSGSRTPADDRPGTDRHGIEGTGTDRSGTDRRDADRLLPRDESDRLAEQMRHAVAGFVDGPGTAVEEADRVLEEAAARFTDAVAQRRRSLRRAWQPLGEGDGDGRNGRSGTPNADTEVLRLALRDYRELTDRLLSR